MKCENWISQASRAGKWVRWGKACRVQSHHIRPLTSTGTQAVVGTWWIMMNGNSVVEAKIGTGLGRWPGFAPVNQWEGVLFGKLNVKDSGKGAILPSNFSILFSKFQQDFCFVFLIHEMSLKNYGVWLSAWIIRFPINCGVEWILSLLTCIPQNCFVGTWPNQVKDKETLRQFLPLSGSNRN